MKYLKFILLIIFILAILGVGYFWLFRQNKTPAENRGADVFENNNVQVQIRDMTNVPAEYFSGNSRFSNGACKIDADCFNIGCSLEMCASNKDLMTTCEINASFPDKDKYSCGCIKDFCGWYLK